MSPTSSPDTAWCLRLVDGNMAWSTWPVPETGLVVGRGLGCHLRLDDARVSRVQCEVFLREGAPVLRNRSTRNPTFVNGAMHEEALLQLGDLIEFAGYRIIVDVAAHAGLPAPQQGAPPPTTQTFERSPYLRRGPEAAPPEGIPGFASRLLELFSFLRVLAKCTSLDMLIDELRNHLVEHLHPDQCWIAWRVRANGDIVLFPAASARETAAAPLDTLKQACGGKCGVLVPLPEAGGTVVLAAPLLHAGVAFGAVGVRSAAGREPYEEHDLHYLLAAAECAAPLIRGMEHMEQLQRDEHLLTGTPAAETRLVGSSEAMRDLRVRIGHAAAWRNNVLILGETGTGKELAARMLHEASPRAQGPYVVVNCAAIPGDLFESEMFGHERGAFTGATQLRKGLFEVAHGGTLLLDEVGELSPANQARLLRVVETHEFRRVGGTKDIHVDVRIVSATNRRLTGAGDTHFRPDLYHRLAGTVLWIPPLRDRADEIPELARHFLAGLTRQIAGCPAEISDEAMQRLQAHPWPGNVRELRNVLERCCYTATGPVITEVDLPTVRQATPAVAEKGHKSLDEVERSHLAEVLRTHEGNVAEAARALDMPASTLYYKLRRHGIHLRNR